MYKKYEILKDDTVYIHDTTLYRIKSLSNFGLVCRGDLGEICSYTWNEEKNGWDFNASCMTCGMGWSDFIPYKE